MFVPKVARQGFVAISSVPRHTGTHSHTGTYSPNTKDLRARYSRICKELTVDRSSNIILEMASREGLFQDVSKHI